MAAKRQMRVPAGLTARRRMNLLSGARSKGLHRRRRVILTANQESSMFSREQIPYHVPPPQLYPKQWTQAVPVQAQHPTLGDVIFDLLGNAVIIGLGCAVAYGVYTLISEPEKPVRRCSHCGRTTHTARKCPLTGARTRLTIEKTGTCSGVERGREMCGPCHFHCGHNGDWYNFAVNPRYCRLAA
jgi:hypothetical protein